MRQQLREWCEEAAAKRGAPRQAVDPQADFVPLRPWICGSVAGHPTGLGPRCPHRGHPLHGVGQQRRLSRLCHAGGLAPPASPHATGLAPRMAADAARAAARDPPGLAGERVGRAWAICRVAGAAPRASGLAPLLAPQRRWHLSPRRLRALRPAVDVRPARWLPLAWHWDRLQTCAAPAPRHVAGRLGGGLYRAGGEPDRCAPCRQRGRLVGPAGLARAGLQGHRPRRAGRRRLDLVAAAPRGQGRRREPRQDPAGCVGGPAPATPPAARPSVALGQGLSPRWEPASGRTARPRARAPGGVSPRALACRACLPWHRCEPRLRSPLRCGRLKKTTPVRFTDTLSMAHGGRSGHGPSSAFRQNLPQ